MNDQNTELKSMVDGQVVPPQPSRYRYVLVVLGVLQIFLTSGVIFGWAPLELVLEAEGVFHELCSPDTPVSTVCNKQLVRLGLMFTLASTLFPMVQLPSGYIVDRWGSRAGMVVGQVIFAGGSVMMGLSKSQWLASDALFIPGFVCMGIGGSMSYLAYFPVASLFPTRAATVMAILMGAVDASAGVFFVIKALTLNGVATRSHLFLFYTIIPISIAATFWIWPKNTTEPADDGDFLMMSRDLTKQTFKNQLKTKEFVYLLIFVSVQMLRISYYIETVSDRIKTINGINSTTDYYVDSFGVLLPAGGVVASFLAGPFLDYKGIAFVSWVYNVAAVLCAVTAAIPILQVQIFTFVVFSLVRPFMYTLSAVIVASVFGTTNFGKIYGSTVTLSSFVNFLQYAFLNITHMELHGNYLIIDLILIGSLVAMFFFPYFLTQRESTKKRNVSSEKAGILGDDVEYVN